MRFGEGSNALSCYGYYCRGTIARCYGGEGMRSFRAKEYLILIRSGQGAAFRASMPCPPFMNRFAIGPSLKGRHGYTKGGNVDASYGRGRNLQLARVKKRAGMSNWPPWTETSNRPSAATGVARAYAFIFSHSSLEIA